MVKISSDKNGNARTSKKLQGQKWKEKIAEIGSQANNNEKTR